MARFTLALGVVLLCSACTHTVNPKIAPEKISAVQPPIHARALLLMTPSFETYTTQSVSGIHRFNFKLGEAATRALTDAITPSFDSVEARQIADDETVQWLAGAADTSLTDVLLVPNFDTGGYSDNFWDISGDVRLRLDVRSYRTGQTYSWTGVGHNAGMFRSRGGVTGDALVQAVGALTDSLRVHRAELDLPQ